MRKLTFVAVALVATFALPAGAANITQSGFSPLYLGVDFETATIPTNPDASGNPTTSRAYIARIDLRAPGISFVTTAQSGTLNTTSETISTFAANHKVRCSPSAAAAR